MPDLLRRRLLVQRHRLDVRGREQVGDLLRRRLRALHAGAVEHRRAEVVLGRGVRLQPVRRQQRVVVAAGELGAGVRRRALDAVAVQRHHGHVGGRRPGLRVHLLPKRRRGRLRGRLDVRVDELLDRVLDALRGRDQGVARNAGARHVVELHADDVARRQLVRGQRVVDHRRQVEILAAADDLDVLAQGADDLGDLSAWKSCVTRSLTARTKSCWRALRMRSLSVWR